MFDTFRAWLIRMITPASVAHPQVHVSAFMGPLPPGDVARFYVDTFVVFRNTRTGRSLWEGRACYFAAGSGITGAAPDPDHHHLPRRVSFFDRWQVDAPYEAVFHVEKGAPIPSTIQVFIDLVYAGKARPMSIPHRIVERTDADLR